MTESGYILGMDTETLPPPASTLLDLSDLPAPVVQSIRQLVDSLRADRAGGTPIERKPLMGRFAHLATGSLSPEEFKAMRREAWGAAPETVGDE